MEFIIRKIKFRAGGRFWAATEEQNKNKYGLAGFGIPQEIFNLAPTLPKKIPPYKNLPESQKKIVRNIYNTFNNLWKKHQKDINSVLKKLKTTDFKKTWLKKEIPKTTKIDWPFKKIYIFPGIINGARTQENQLCIGIRPKCILDKNHLIPVLIHELIHINTWKIKPRKLFYKRDGEEIATILLVNKIIKKMNIKFNMHIKNQKLNDPLLNLEKFMPQLKEILNQSKSYKELISKVDRFLKSIKHKAYYG